MFEQHHSEASTHSDVYVCMSTSANKLSIGIRDWVKVQQIDSSILIYT